MEAINVKKLAHFSAEEPTRIVLFASDTFRVSLLCLERRQAIEPHNGACAVLLYALDGHGTFVLGEEEVSVKAGALLVVPSKVVRGVRSAGRLLVLCVTENCGQCELDR